MHTQTIRKVKDLARRDYLERAATKQEPKQSTCRAWIAILNNRWHWSSPSNLQLPNPFRN